MFTVAKELGTGTTRGSLFGWTEIRAFLTQLQHLLALRWPGASFLLGWCLLCAASSTVASANVQCLFFPRKKWLPHCLLLARAGIPAPLLVGPVLFPTVQGALFGIVKLFSMIFHWSALGTFVLPVPKDETGSYGYKGSICSWKVLASEPHAQIPVWQASCMEAQGASPTGLG